MGVAFLWYVYVISCIIVPAISFCEDKAFNTNALARVLIESYSRQYESGWPILTCIFTTLKFNNYIHL